MTKRKSESSGKPMTETEIEVYNSIINSDLSQRLDPSFLIVFLTDLSCSLEEYTEKKEQFDGKTYKLVFKMEDNLYPDNPLFYSFVAEDLLNL